MTSSDRFSVPVRSAEKSNFTNWCCQNLSKRALNALTVQASTTDKVALERQNRATNGRCDIDLTAVADAGVDLSPWQ